MNQLILTCKDFISNNHYLDYSVKRKSNGRPYVHVKHSEATNRFILSFGKYVKRQIKEQNWIKPEKGKFVKIDAIFYLPRVDMDPSNYWKAMFDIFTKFGVWIDDNIAIENVERVYYSKKEPRIELKIYELDNIGIFDNEKQLRNFLDENCSKCSKCLKGKRQCSTFTAGLNNFVDDFSINNNIMCKKIRRDLNELEGA